MCTYRHLCARTVICVHGDLAKGEYYRAVAQDALRAQDISFIVTIEIFATCMGESTPDYFPRQQVRCGDLGVIQPAYTARKT